jgi:ketosteroid isomerase-like protein
MNIAATRATTPDYDAIVHVVQLYIDAFNDGSVAKFKEAFHEDAWIFFTDAQGALHKALLTDCFEDWAAPHPSRVVGRFISVVQAGDVAVVVLGFDWGSGRSHSWVDIHSLLRIDGIWKIMNKTATHNSRAAWAGDGYPLRQDVTPHTKKPRGS